tara:strand:+ start:1673 stop:2149 length:477 start_codon:yes stop_codon:yes gene_type:complete
MLEEYINTYDITRYDYLHIYRVLDPAGKIVTMRYILSNYKCADKTHYEAGFNYRSARSYKRKTGKKQDWRADLERGRKSNCLVHEVHMPTTNRHWGERQQRLYDHERQLAKQLMNEALFSYRPATEDMPAHNGTTMIHSMLHTVGAKGEYTHTVEVMA